MRLNIVFITIGIIVLTLVGIINAVLGFGIFGYTTFGPNFYSAVVGFSIGGALSLLVVLISFKLQQSSKEEALQVARYVFLRKDGERFKDAYVNFLETLRIAAAPASVLGGASWQAMDTQFWPKLDEINNIKNALKTAAMSGTYDLPSVEKVQKELKEATEGIIQAATTEVFEGRHQLVAPFLWDADYDNGMLFLRILTLKTQHGADAVVPAQSFKQSLTDAAQANLQILEGLVRFSQNVKIKKQ
jgi:hypothetical protein